MLALFVKVQNVASRKDPQFFRGSQIFCGSRSASARRTSPLVTWYKQAQRQICKNKFSNGCSY